MAADKIVFSKIAYATVDKTLHETKLANHELYILTKDAGLVEVSTGIYHLQHVKGEYVWGWVYNTAEESYRFDDDRIVDFYIVESGL